MAHRHKMHKKGGRVVYEGSGSNVAHEAEEKGAKRGGHMHKHGGKVHGHHSKHRLDKRARGGGVGSDKAPFSSAGSGLHRFEPGAKK